MCFGIMDLARNRDVQRRAFCHQEAAAAYSRAGASYCRTESEVHGVYASGLASRKVDRPMARLSEAPMRVCTESKTCMRADSAGTKDPTCSGTTSRDLRAGGISLLGNLRITPCNN